MLILSIVLLGILVFFLLGLHIAAGIGVLSFILMVFVSPRPNDRHHGADGLERQQHQCADCGSHVHHDG